MERGAHDDHPATGAAPDVSGRYDDYPDEPLRPDPLADLMAGFDDRVGPPASGSGSAEGGDDVPAGAPAAVAEPIRGALGDPTPGDASTAAPPDDTLGALAAATTERGPETGQIPAAARPGAAVEDAIPVVHPEGADWQSVAEQRIDVLMDLVRSAKGRAMSSGQCIVNRADVLERLTDVRSLLPTELGAAAAVLREKNRILTTARADAQAQLADASARADALVSEATERADALMQDGLAEQERLVSAAAVTAVAARQAEFMVNDANRRAERRRQETDEYVDARLAAFEALLQKTLTQVLRGRERMHEEMAAYRSDDYADDAPPRAEPDGWEADQPDHSSPQSGRG